MYHPRRSGILTLVKRLLVLLVLPLVACSSGHAKVRVTAAPSTSLAAMEVRGSLLLSSVNNLGATNGIVGSSLGDDCWGEGGYGDITGGAQVVVSDEAGKTVGLGKLAGGKFRKGYNDAPECEFQFVVEGVPSGHPFYGVEVSHRGVTKYTQDDLSKFLNLTLGDGS